ncbi:ABC transporter ATP-binding protein/permease [Millisia brevis]|uniref:ABC transporter ATP-binding protein/permease n=1 Tax=Millisia brevis TaxID=264148 RepID=UPI000A002B3B|nr:ATP-binding cassette domain-containing protein [Millisia brevis]
MLNRTDWSDQLLDSLLWVIQAFVMSAIGVALAAILLVRFTAWGAQFARVTGGYFPATVRSQVWGELAAMLLLVVVAVRINLLLVYQFADTFGALHLGDPQVGAVDAADASASFRRGLLIVVILLLAAFVRWGLARWLAVRFDLRWQTWLTAKVLGDWLADRAYYRSRFIDETVDNPDQRISMDVEKLVRRSRQLAVGVVGAVVTVAAFTSLLWDLSGSLGIGGLSIPRALIIFGVLYVIVVALVTVRIAGPLVGLEFWNERLAANYRYALVRLRESAENVAFYRGEQAESSGVLDRFDALVDNDRAVRLHRLRLDAWTLVSGVVAALLAAVIQAPRVIDGTLSFEGLLQSILVFVLLERAFAFAGRRFGRYAALRSALDRLDALFAANARSRALPTVGTTDTTHAVRVDGVEVRTPLGEVLVEGLDVTLSPGEGVVVKGASGSGKTTLLRGLSGMWPFADGHFGRPPDADGTLFVSQTPYLPLGSLRSAVVYPADPAGFGDADLRTALVRVQLGHLAERLDQEADWAKILSPGEQQRVAFARVILLRPSAVFLDEATSAIDEGLEHWLYSLIREELPNLIMISVAHRSTIEGHHTHRLNIDGGGRWRMTDIR